MKWLEKFRAGKRDQILFLLLLGVLLMVIAVPSGVPEKPLQPETEGVGTQQELSEENRLEAQLQELFTQVVGIGKTQVMLSFASDGRQIVEKDQEYQAEGGSGENGTGTGLQSSRESTVYQKDGSGNETPYVTETLAPQVSGVLVIAQGGGNAVVVKEITEAVMALFGVEPHKIKVMKMQ